MRYKLTDYEWTAIKPFLPNKPRGVPRLNDRRVLNGIFWVLRSTAPYSPPWCPPLAFLDVRPHTPKFILGLGRCL
jgi:transposase